MDAQASLTAGIFNLTTSLFLLAFCLAAARVLYRALQAGVTVEWLLSGHPPVFLNKLSAFTTELQILTPKNLGEFIAIYAVIEVPKRELAQLAVPCNIGQGEIFSDTNMLPPLAPTQVRQAYLQVPRQTLRTCFASARRKQGPGSVWAFICSRDGWADQRRERKFSSDSYTLMGGGDALDERLLGRIQRMLARYAVLEEEMVVRRRGVDRPTRASFSDASSEYVAAIILTSPRFSGPCASFELSIVEHTAELPNSASGLKTTSLYFPLQATFPHQLTHYEEVPSGIFGFEDNASPECMICCDAIANTVLLDCCHTCTCEGCTNSFRDGKCPICRSLFGSKIILPVKCRPTSRASVRRGSLARNLLD